MIREVTLQSTEASMNRKQGGGPVSGISKPESKKEIDPKDLNESPAFLADLVKTFDLGIEFPANLVAHHRPGENWVSASELIATINEASKVSGIPVHWIKSLIVLEATRRSRGGISYFDTYSVSPSGDHHGLGQFEIRAWKDAVRLLKTKGVGPTEMLQTFSVSSARDVSSAIYAIAGYGMANRGYAQHYGYGGEFDFPLFYAMHNQGPGLITSIKKKIDNGLISKYQYDVIGGQSPNAISLVRIAEGKVANYFSHAAGIDAATT